MCKQGFQSRLAPLTAAHADRLVARFPKDEDLIRDLFQALSAGLNPHFNTLALLFLMAKRHKERRYGLAGELWGKAIRFPLSVVTPEDGTRYRTPLLAELHDSMLSLNMSQGTMERVNGALRMHGLAVRMMCSCGVVVTTPKIAATFTSDPTVLAMDRYRSSLDGLGRPVHRVAAGQVPSRNMDWAEEDRSFHDDLDRLVDDLAAVPFDEASFLRDQNLDGLGAELLRVAERARRVPSGDVAA